MEMNLLRSRDYQTLPAVKDFRLIEHNSEVNMKKSSWESFFVGVE